MLHTTPGTATAVNPSRLRRYSRTLRGSLAVAGFLAAIFVVYTALVVNWGPLVRLDHWFDRDYHVQTLYPVLTRVDRIGQRAVCLPILAIVVVVTGWRHRTWRPAMLAAIAVFAVNLIVLIAKVAMGRGRPLTDHGWFSGGDMYPSGHTANIVLVYGLCFHLIAHYGDIAANTKRVLLWVVCVLSVVMFVTSLTLRWHWFSDLVGGFMVGGAVLALTVGVDVALTLRSRRLVALPSSEGFRQTPSGSRAAAADRRFRR
jgi:membrane-associated phospholipid phosphatase